MRIFNGTKSYLDLPITGIQRIQVPAHSVSKDFMPSTEFLSLLVGSYDYSEVALIVSGPYEINMCAGVSGSVGFVVQSLEEAIERFTPKTPEVVVEEKPAEVVEEVETKVEPKVEAQEETKETPKEEKKEKKEKKTRRWDKEDEKKTE